MESRQLGDESAPKLRPAALTETGNVGTKGEMRRSETIRQSLEHDPRRAAFPSASHDKPHIENHP